MVLMHFTTILNDADSQVTQMKTQPKERIVFENTFPHNAKMFRLSFTRLTVYLYTIYFRNLVDIEK